MKYALLISLILLGFVSYSQTITKATSRGWAGGVCCVSGTRYSVHLQFDKTPQEISIESIYLKGHGEISGTIQKYTNPSKEVEHIVSFGTESNGIIIMDPEGIDKTDPPEFKGVALIILNVNHKTVELIVEAFERLMFISYP